MKIKLILGIFFISFQVYAEAKLEFHINLFVYSSMGKVIGIKDIKVKDQTILVDDSPLSPVEVTIKSKHLATILKTNKSSDEYCDNGKFIFRVDRNGENSIESGCIDSKRFSEINKAFNKMRKDLVLK